jgi:hypothetical protein
VKPADGDGAVQLRIPAAIITLVGAFGLALADGLFEGAL